MAEPPVWGLHLITPPGWRDHARRFGGVLLLVVGSGLHLTDATDKRRLKEHAIACARAGQLISALVPYAEPGPARHSRR